MGKVENGIENQSANFGESDGSDAESMNNEYESYQTV